MANSVFIRIVNVMCLECVIFSEIILHFYPIEECNLVFMWCCSI